MKCWKFMLALVLLLFLSGGLYTKASADEMLYTFNLDEITEDGEYKVVGVEPFIALSDCRRRGYQNVSLMWSLGVRGGFVCDHIVEPSDGV
jgi:hypothetical protein